MPDPQRRLILANGEQYALPVTKKPSGRAPEPPRSYDEARTLVKGAVSQAIRELDALPAEKKLPGEAVLCLRIHPDATAKSYDPVALFEQVPELQNVGSRNYRVPAGKVAKTKRVEKKIEAGASEVEGRLVFIRSTPAGFQRLLDRLDVPTGALTQQFTDEIRRVEHFDQLSADEQILGFDPKWREGRAELVFHPSKAAANGQREFLFELFEYCGIDFEKSHIREYPPGPTFVSCHLTRPMLSRLAGTNPLRAAHPLKFGGLEDLRGAPTVAAPKPPASTTRSTIKVGMFDGGVDPSLDLLAGHVEEDTSLAIATTPRPDFVAHGTAVAGALLHGPLNGFDAKDRLPVPGVYVVSIRALPASDPVDLYESIDVIERAVPARKDIKVFNVSFGPRGPILDDRISRFTYVLDALAIAHKVTFIVAVGNDGEMTNYDRVQTPSDLAHGLGVGAFTHDGTSKVHAPYSCKGPGRECAKMKPDLAAFGGCKNSPIHLVSALNAKMSLAMGTSFAAPSASRVCAQATECFERATPLLGRALLVHTAQHPDGQPDYLLGHGCVLPTIDDILYCPAPGVTVVFLGDLLPTKMVRLPVPLPSDLQLPGNVKVTWTVAALTPIDANHPTEYTCACVEDTFYPHSQNFQFTKLENGKAKSKRLNLQSDAAEVKKILTEGWKQASFPATSSGNKYKYKDEGALRAIDCKWEPLVRRSVSMRGTSLFEPFLILHAISRNRGADRFEYAALVTIEASKFNGDLYTEIRRRYPALAPIRLRTEAEIRVQI